MREQNWVHLDVDEIVQETSDAFLVRLEDGDEHWIPKSQIADADDYEKGDRDAVISITEWIAEQKGLG